MKARIFRVKVIGKDADGGTYDVQAKDDVAARTKAVKLWLKDFNQQLKEARETDEQNGDTIYRGEYTEKDVSYCEVSLFTEVDG